MSAASRKKVILGLSAFGVVVALVVAGVVALNVVNGMHGPDKAVESYLTLLSEGKATEATKMVDPGVPNDQRKLLTDDALRPPKRGSRSPRSRSPPSLVTPPRSRLTCPWMGRLSSTTSPPRRRRALSGWTAGRWISPSWSPRTSAPPRFRG